MAINLSSLPEKLSWFVRQTLADAALSTKVLGESGTLASVRTLFFFQRVPGENTVVLTTAPDPWKPNGDPYLAVATLDGEALLGSAAGVSEFGDILRERPEIDTVIHVHTPFLGAWAAAHRTLPLRYVAAQRHTLIREIPIYIDRRQTQARFILDRLAEDSRHFAILEANGGATFWGKNIIETSKTIELVEEAARFQTIAEQIGGAKDYGPGVLEQQWTRTGLYRAAAE